MYKVQKNELGTTLLNKAEISKRQVFQDFIDWRAFAPVITMNHRGKIKNNSKGERHVTSLMKKEVVYKTFQPVSRSQ